MILKEQQKPSATITLLYGAKEEKFNNAAALKEYLEEKIKEYQIDDNNNNNNDNVVASWIWTSVLMIDYQVQL